MFEDAGRLAQIIDHTLVRPDATIQDITTGCEEAIKYGFAAFIANSCHVARARAILAGTTVKVGSVVGFPHGASTTTVKIVEAMEAIKNGAEELDIVINIGLVKSGRYDLMDIDMKNIIVMTPNTIHKIIVETGYLTTDEIANVCRLAVKAGAEFVKTSSGYGPRGASVDDVRLIREVVGSLCRVKASGGIRDLATVQALVEAGAERIGTSAGVSIMEEYMKQNGRGRSKI
jgi:deoxyribose-phosphate aldolase